MLAKDKNPYGINKSVLQLERQRVLFDDPGLYSS